MKKVFVAFIAAEREFVVEYLTVYVENDKQSRIY